jgi:MoxR-like ATPase
MADSDKPPQDDSTQTQGVQVDSGNYEVLRRRLTTAAATLQDRIDRLNVARAECFGGSGLAVAGTARLHTGQTTRLADFLRVGDDLVTSYHFVGMKHEVTAHDVFGVWRLERDDGAVALHEIPLEDGARGLFTPPQFQRDLSDLYRYGRNVRLLALRQTEDQILAVFAQGSDERDRRVFRWQVDPRGTPTYLDNRGDANALQRRQFDFQWTPVVRDDHRDGRFPHISILDEVFVETIGGTLTIKVENSTESGEGIYDEPVDDPRQTLDDARIDYARLGALIALRIRPYNEEAYRHFLYNTRTRTVHRVEAIRGCCLQLPEGHGAIFPGGYFLETGEFKQLDGDPGDLSLDRVVRSPNGEDVAYIFFDARTSRYLLVLYNLIRKDTQPPIACNAWALMEDGTLVLHRADGDEATRAHNLQLWVTPFTTQEYAARAPVPDTFLARIGNAELVRGISDSLSVVRLITQATPSVTVYNDLLRQVRRVQDAYHWIDHEEAGDLRTPLQAILTAADLIIEEFRKVEELRLRAEQERRRAEQALDRLLGEARTGDTHRIEHMMDVLVKLRTAQGHCISLRDLRYADLDGLTALQTRIEAAQAEWSATTVEQLQQPSAFDGMQQALASLHEALPDITRSHEVDAVLERLQEQSRGLDVLNEVVAGLEIADATVRAEILGHMGEVYGNINRLRATAEARRRSLGSAEQRAEFAAQFALLSQSISSAMSQADTPERCDEQLSRVLLQIQDLEARFSEFDEFLAQLHDRREEALEGFDQRRRTLVDERLARVRSLMAAATRTVDAVRRRALQLKSLDEINTLFASDPMILKLRQLCGQLVDLGDSSAKQDIEARIQTARQEAVRAARDASELFDDAGLIQLGRHRFSVNEQPFDLALVPQDDGMYVHLTGTSFYDRLEDPRLHANRAFWTVPLPSEDEHTYRGEFLAARLLLDAQRRGRGALAELVGLADDATALLAKVRTEATEHYDEGYERGVHDQDATAILAALLHLVHHGDLLRYRAQDRCAAQLAWAGLTDAGARESLVRRAANARRLGETFGDAPRPARLHEELHRVVADWLAGNRVDAWRVDAHQAADYLMAELGERDVRFLLDPDAEALAMGLHTELELKHQRQDFDQDLQRMPQVVDAVETAMLWLDTWARSAGQNPAPGAVLESAVYLVLRQALERRAGPSLRGGAVHGLIGRHARIVDGDIPLHLDEFLPRLRHHMEHTAPAWRAFRQLRASLADEQRRVLRIDEYAPRVMTSFVRNRLIQEVYLPLIGDNLAKQMGAAGPSRRTDQSGMLLLISPPGYGKTTLMEYVASRLGLIFMKVNGPSLGHNVVSLDPDEAPNATARQEVEKVNLALEMADNVMLYLDDIQHTNPEFLQKFISLCDGQRRIEGVWRGRTRTYDMRGRRFCIAMAGNPYTESGDRFQIPDMLANRADTYNLGDVLGGHEDLFSLSYLENALTSHPVLAQLSGRDLQDVYRLVRMARGFDDTDVQWSWGYSAAEIQELVTLFRHLLQIQATLLKVNAEYIRSASQEDAYRTEPPFKLQGSYRNMAKLAEKVAAAMNADEVEALLDDHYQGESQTLTTGAEQNLLKLAHMRGRATEAQQARWEEICREYRRQQVIGSGAEDDAVGRVLGGLSALGLQVDGIREALQGVARAGAEARGLPPELSEALARVPALLQSALAPIETLPGLLQTALARPGAPAPVIQVQPTPIQVAAPSIQVQPTPVQVLPAQVTVEAPQVTVEAPQVTVEFQAPALLREGGSSSSGAVGTPVSQPGSAGDAPWWPELQRALVGTGRLLHGVQQTQQELVQAIQAWQAHAAAPQAGDGWELPRGWRPSTATADAGASAGPPPSRATTDEAPSAHVAEAKVNLARAISPLVVAATRNLDQTTAATGRMIEIMDSLKLFLRHLNSRHQDLDRI